MNEKQRMEYNTQRRRLPLPEYGRSVQNMVDHALTIEDREERQRCANTIVNIMEGMFPYLRDLPDFRHKLWDHLAIMSDFKLDIDYPYEVVKKEGLEVKADRISYQNGSIRYRHYGRLLLEIIKKAEAIEDKEEQRQLVNFLANQMKRSLITWKKEIPDEQKIVDDLRELSHGALDYKVEDLDFNEQRAYNNQRKQQYNNQRRQSSNNQRKKY